MRSFVIGAVLAAALALTADPAAAQVDGQLWGDPDPFQSGSTIQVNVYAWWDMAHPSCMNQYACRPEYVWVDVNGSNGFTAHSEGSVSEFTNSQSWTFSDALPGQQMVSTSYYASVTVQWLDTELGWRYWGSRGFDGSVSPQPPTINGPATVWWFNGQQPPDYDTSIGLQTDGGPDAQWEVVGGNATLSTTTGASTVLTATAPSFLLNDIRVRVSRNGVYSAEFGVTARAPNTLRPRGSNTECDGYRQGYDTFGYLTSIHYTARDQFGVDLTSTVGVNELLTSFEKDVSFTNWRPGNPANGNGPAFKDVIGGENLALPPVPYPGCNGNATPVVHQHQEIRIGSLSSGAGILVQAHTLQRYLDFGAHVF